MEEYQDDELSESRSIDWEMEEFLDHKRNWVWYVVVLGASLVIGFLVYYITKDLIAPVAIVVAMTALVIFSLKKPQKRKYSLTSLGIKIGNRLYDYNGFKTYSLIEEDGVRALYLMTNQRFVPPITIYLPTQLTKDIIRKINQYIVYAPTENLRFTDRLIQYLRF